MYWQVDRNLWFFLLYGTGYNGLFEQIHRRTLFFEFHIRGSLKILYILKPMQNEFKISFIDQDLYYDYFQQLMFKKTFDV